MDLQMIISQRTCMQIYPQNSFFQAKTFLQFSLSSKTQIIHLFARQIIIQQVKIQNQPVQFIYPFPQTEASLLNQLLNSSFDSLQYLKVQQTIRQFQQQTGGLCWFSVPENLRKERVSVQITYRLQDPVSGLRFYKHKKKWVVHTLQMLETTRLWMPCIDTLTSKYPLQLEFKVPLNYKVVSSGNFQSFSQDQNFAYFSFFEQKAFIDSIGFCVAEIQEIIQDPNNINFTYFSLLKHQTLLSTANNSFFTMQNIVSYLSTEIGQIYPFKQLKLVFLPSIGKTCHFASLSIIDEQFLIDCKTHQLVPKTTQTLVEAVCYNWFGAHVRCENWNDYWLIRAIPQYYKRSYLGISNPNKLKFLIQKKIKQYCSYVKQGLEQHPLCSCFFSNPGQLHYDKVYQLKSGLILHMIASKVGAVHLSKAIKQMAFFQSSEHKKQNPCSTRGFIKSIKKLCAVSMVDFARTWIYGTGAPKIVCKVKDNPASNCLEVNIHQTPLFLQYLQSPANSSFRHIDEQNFEIPIRCNAMRFYVGPLSIHLYETDGQELEISHHQIEFQNEVYITQFSYKKTLRKQNSSRRKEDPEEKMKTLESPFLWIRVDPEFQLLREVEVIQPEKNWKQQLLKEKHDILSQCDAIKALRIYQDYSAILQMLELVLRNQQFYCKVRIQAAKSLALMSSPINAFKGLDYLIYYYKQNHFQNQILLSNNFSNTNNYFVDKGVLKSIISVNDMSLTHHYQRLRVNSSFLVQFMADLIKNNDNSLNPIQDYYWVSNLLKIIGSTSNPVYIEQIVQELNRNLQIDLVLGSPRSIVTQACFQGFLSIAKTHKYDLTDLFTRLLSQIRRFLPRIQMKIINFYTDYCFVRQENPLIPFRFILQQLKFQPYHRNFYSQNLWHFLSKLSTQHTLLLSLRQSNQTLLLIWKTIISPFASINQIFNIRVFSIYSFIFPIKWQNYDLDPIWQEKWQQFELGASHRVQPVDLSQGTWHDWANQIWKRMSNHQYSTPFLEPVNADQATDYYDKIQNPMDLDTAYQKLNGGEYGRFQDFAADIRLIFSNCKQYNQEGSDLYYWAETLQEFFNVLAKPIEQTFTETQEIKEGGFKVKIIVN